jgi:hypothetical protein
VICCDLAQWDDNGEALEIWEQLVGIASKDKAFFRELVTLPMLEGDANWTGADKPIQYLRTAMKNNKRDAEKEGWARQQREVPLEALVGMPAESADYGVDTDIEFDEAAREALEESLKKIAEVDPDLAVYGTLRLRGEKHKEIKARFGWSWKHSYNIQVRFLRWQKNVAAGILAEHASLRTRGAVSDASRTVEYEILKGGTLGSARPRSGKYPSGDGKHRNGGGLGVWKHRNLPPKP